MRVLIDLTRAPAVPEVYSGSGYGLAIHGLMQLASVLDRAGCAITVLADPEFLHSLEVEKVLRKRRSIQTMVAPDQSVFPQTLDALRPDACVIWNGCHVPHLSSACREHGTRVIFAEAGWFARESSAFVDDWGVMVGSSLSKFEPDADLSDGDRQARLEPIARTAERRRLLKGEYLLLLLDFGTGWTYFDQRHKDPLVIIKQLRLQFPDLKLAVRAHPKHGDVLAGRLPKGVVDASEGALLDWVAFCTATIGASSKAAFAPALYDKQTILIGGSVASGPRPSPAFLQRNRIAAITEVDLLDSSRYELARAFVYEAVFHRHVFFDDTPSAIAENRILAPLLN